MAFLYLSASVELILHMQRLVNQQQVRAMQCMRCNRVEESVNGLTIPQRPETYYSDINRPNTSLLPWIIKPNANSVDAELLRCSGNPLVFMNNMPCVTCALPKLANFYIGSIIK
jgi:hypothetical protein